MPGAPKQFYASFVKARDEAGLASNATLAELIVHHRVDAAATVVGLIQTRRGMADDELDVYGTV